MEVGTNINAGVDVDTGMRMIFTSVNKNMSINMAIDSICLCRCT